MLWGFYFAWLHPNIIKQRLCKTDSLLHNSTQFTNHTHANTHAFIFSLLASIYRRHRPTFLNLQLFLFPRPINCHDFLYIIYPASLRSSYLPSCPSCLQLLCSLLAVPSCCTIFQFSVLPFHGIYHRFTSYPVYFISQGHAYIVRSTL